MSVQLTNSAVRDLGSEVFLSERRPSLSLTGAQFL